MKNALCCMILLPALALLFGACNGKNDETNGDVKIITERIEYPVFIKDPYNEETAEWWKENIETSKRQDFVELLFDWAYSGKVKCFDFLTNEPLSTEKVRTIGNETDTVTITENFPPYDEKDTIIQNKLDFSLIHKIKFLEEWQFDLENHVVSKKVIGLAPTLTVFGDSSEVKGYKPLFWIYFDEKYIMELKNGQ